MRNFQPHIIPVYPPNNHLIFEEWFAQNYKGCNTDRVLLPFFPTSYWVNNNYAQDLVAKKEAQDYIDSLPNDVKYFVICQYDDGCLIDWGNKDVLEFNMSKTNGIMLPLICQPHPYKYDTNKRWLSNFVGGRTHPIRNYAEKLKLWEVENYVSFDIHSIDSYCKILHESIYTICFRGYGSSSFRICEAMQYGSMPIYVSDEFIIPFNINFSEYGLIVPEKEIDNLMPIMESITPEEIMIKQKNMERYYTEYYTYEGCFKNIIRELETEDR